MTVLLETRSPFKAGTTIGQKQAWAKEDTKLDKLPSRGKSENNLAFPFPLPSKISPVSPLSNADRSQLNWVLGNASDETKLLSWTMEQERENRLGVIGPRTSKHNLSPKTSKLAVWSRGYFSVQASSTLNCCGADNILSRKIEERKAVMGWN